MGVRIMVLDPTPGCPASSVAAQIVGSFRDSAAVKQIAQLVRFCRQTSSILTGSNAGWPTANSRLRMSATCPVTRSQPGCQSMIMAVQCKICHPHVNVGLLFESSVSAMQCRLCLAFALLSSLSTLAILLQNISHYHILRSLQYTFN